MFLNQKGKKKKEKKIFFFLSLEVKHKNQKTLSSALRAKDEQQKGKSSVKNKRLGKYDIIRKACMKS